MARWTTRITTVVTVLMLTGAPAVLASCAALCTSGMTGGQDRPGMPGDAMMGQAAQHAGEPSTLPSGHHHHVMASDAQPGPAIGRATAAAPAAVVRIAGNGHDCCPDRQALGLSAVAAGRQDTQGASAALAPRTSPVVVTLSVQRARVPGTTHWPPSPPSTSTVLRI